MEHEDRNHSNLRNVNITDAKSPRFHIRTPSNSCHDFCKYGKKHDGVPAHLGRSKVTCEHFSAKKFGSPLARRIRRLSTLKSVSQPESMSRINKLQQSDVSGDLLECYEESESMPKTPSSFQKSIIACEGNSLVEDGSPTELKIIKPEEGQSNLLENVPSAAVQTSRQAKGPPDRFGCMKKESSDDMRKSIRSAMGVSSKDSAGFKPKEEKLLKGLNVSEKQKREVAMIRSPQLAKSIAPIRVKGKKTIDTFVKPKIPPLGDEPVLSVRHQEANLIHVDNQNSYLSPIITKKRSMSPKRIQVSPKPALQLKTKSAVLKPMPQLMVTGRITGQRSLEKRMMSMTASMLKVGGKKVSNPNAAASPYKSTNNVAPKRSVKSQVGSGRLDSEKVEEKILHVVQQKLLTPKHLKMRSPQQSSTSLPSRSSISCAKNVMSSFNEAKAGAHLQSGDKTRPPCSDKTDDKRKQKKITNVPVEDDSLPPRNMPSHERKVGGAQRVGTGQRRLRFRNANGAAETQNAIGEISMKGLTNVRQPNITNLAPRSHDSHFVLRHQDVQEKNSQVLFNDVIEETANRLAEVRKSKVKALVGAFETIISLQEKAIY